MRALHLSLCSWPTLRAKKLENVYLQLSVFMGTAAQESRAIKLGRVLLPVLTQGREQDLLGLCLPRAVLAHQLLCLQPST